MREFAILTTNPVTTDEAVELYASVGWSAYTREPAGLDRAINGTSFVVTARGTDETL